MRCFKNCFKTRARLVLLLALAWLVLEGLFSCLKSLEGLRDLPAFKLILLPFVLLEIQSVEVELHLQTCSPCQVKEFLRQQFAHQLIPLCHPWFMSINLQTFPAGSGSSWPCLQVQLCQSLQMLRCIAEVGFTFVVSLSLPPGWSHCLRVSCSWSLSASQREGQMTLETSSFPIVCLLQDSWAESFNYVVRHDHP